MIGRILAGRYELVRLLGRGGMGEVWQAHDTRIRRSVAVKLVARDPADPAGADLLFREAHITGGLRHPGVVTVFDLGEDPDSETLYLVMELLEGRDLARVLAGTGLPEIALAVDWSAQVADALAVAHAKGVVHRDLKPSNLMLTTEGTVKVLDFGIARFASSTTRSSQVIGTIAYMAPERVRGESGDARGDLYSLGWVLHELLTGQKPFGTAEPMALMYAHLETPPERPGALRSGVPPELDDLVLALLAKDPGGRPASASEAAAQLAGLADALRAPEEAGHDVRPIVVSPSASPATERSPATPREGDAPAKATANVPANAAANVPPDRGSRVHALPTAPAVPPSFPAQRSTGGRKFLAILAAATACAVLLAWIGARVLGGDSSGDPSGDAAAGQSTRTAPGDASGTYRISTGTAATTPTASSATPRPSFTATSADQKAIVEAYSLVFNGATPISRRKEYIQDADRMGPYIDELFDNPVTARVGAEVIQADVTGATADVWIYWLNNGTGRMSGEFEVGAVKEGDRWLVGAKAICRLFRFEGEDAPPPCADY